MNRQEIIQQKLIEALLPVHLEVQDESHMHNVPKGAESHFRVIAVSEVFSDKQLLARHRLVNKVLEDDLNNGIHALALHTVTSEEWRAKGGQLPASPPCLNGRKNQ